jgi:tripartite-type tricarboxylate transporter receptor subunit TctC
MSPFSQPRRRFLETAGAAGAAAIALPAGAQAGFPRGPLKMVVGVPPGGSADIIARALAQALEPGLKQSVVVENRPGGQFQIAAQTVQNAPADGHTLWYMFNTILGVQVTQKLYDIEKSFTPVARVATTPFALATRADSRFTSFQSCLDYARANPGKVTYATYGPGSVEHLLLMRIMQETGARFTPVAYKGGPDAVKDLLGGEVDVAPLVGVFFGKMYKDKLRALMLFDPVRWKEMPEIPTLPEVGLKMPPIITWGGVMVRAGTPDEIVQRLYREISAAATNPAFAERLLPTANYPSVSPSVDDFRQQLRSELAMYGAAASQVTPGN